jgi:hypothetical protein
MERATLSVRELVARIEDELGQKTIALIYCEQVCPQRTRRIELPPVPAAARVEVQETLLGTELQVGRTRLPCPDLSTAQYLSLFARLRLRAIAIPTDMRQLRFLLPELESSWFQMMMLAETRVEPFRETTVAQLKRGLIERQRTLIIAFESSLVKLPGLSSSRRR